MPGGKTGHLRISDVTNGVATLKFWGETEGTYQIKVYTQNGKDPSKKIEYGTISITLNISQVPNRVLVTKQHTQEFLKAGGTAGTYALQFKRVYTNPDTGVEMPAYSINVDTSNISIGYGANGNPTSQYLIETITREGSNNTSATLKLTPKDRDEQVNVTETVKIYVNSEEMPLYIDGSPSTLSVVIKPKAKYNLKFDNITRTEGNTQIKDDITLYYKSLTSQGGLEGSVRTVDGTLYTLYGVSLVDQYGDKGQDIINNMLITNTDTDYAISFDDKGTSKIIKTKGFKQDGSPCILTGDTVRYIGIGIDQTAFKGDEDEEFVSRGLMKGGANSIEVEQAGTIVAKLNVKEIVKNDVTSLRTSNVSSSDYRYSVDESTGTDKKPRIIGQIKSGATQENLIPSDLTYKVEDLNNGLNDVTSNMRIEGEASNTGLGRINVRFRSPMAGKYRITVGVRNKPSATTSFDITITEDPRINMVKFTGNRKVTPTISFGEVAQQTPVTREIIYYHDYSDIAGNGVSPVEIGIDGSVPVINGGSNPSQITITGNSDLTVSAIGGWPNDAHKINPGSGEKVNYIEVKCNKAMISVPSFTVKLDQTINDGITTTWSQTLTVPVTPVEKIEMTSVKLTNLSGGNRATLAYKMTDDEIEAKGLTGQLVNIGNTTYSVFKIWYEDKSGTLFKVKASEIATSEIDRNINKILITDDKERLDEGQDLVDTTIQVYGLNYEDELYSLAGVGDTIDYVGIVLDAASRVSEGSEIGAFLNPLDGRGWSWSSLANKPDSKLTVSKVYGSPTDLSLISTTTFNVGDSVENTAVKEKADGLPKADIPIDDKTSVSMPNISIPEQVIKPEEGDSDGSAEIVTKPGENEGTVTEENNKPSGEETKPAENSKPEDSTSKPNGADLDKPKEPEDKTAQDNPESDLPID